MNVSTIKQHGFTIVELLVVIVVIGILAGISTVAYAGVQQRAQNAALEAEFNNWEKAFLAYKALNGEMPAMPDGGYCLGTGFPNGKCRDYALDNANTYRESDSGALMDALKTVVTPSSGRRVPINGTVGPYVNYGPGYIELTLVMHGNSADDCPDNTHYTWSDGNGRLLCYIDFER